MMNRTISTALALLLSVLLLQLAACGFKKRGAIELPEQMSVTYIQGDRYGDIQRALRNVYITGGAKIASDRNEADSILRLIDVEFKQDTLSVSERGKVLEFQLTYSVLFDVSRPDGAVLVEQQRIVLERAYFNPDTEVLGREREKTQLKKEMARNMAQQIATRIYARLSGGL